MRTKPLFTLLLFVGPILSLAQDNLAYSAFLIPDKLEENAHEVIRSETMEFTVLSEKSGELYYHTVITILDNKSTDNHVTIGYDDDSKVDKIEANIYDAAGRLVRKIKKNGISDYAAVDGFSIYQDNRYKYMDLSYHTLPFTIEYEYRKKMEGRHFFDYPDWQATKFNTSVEQAKFVVHTPVEYGFIYEALNVDQEPSIVNDGKMETYTWEVKNMPAIKEEGYDPPLYEIFPMVNISPKVFQFDKYQGSMESWKNFGAFIYQLFEGKDQLPEEMANRVHELTDGIADNQEKIRVLYKYLQENMRYVSVQLGIGGYQPFDASYVYDNKYGDCKALSNFMKGMLKEAGIESYPVIIKSSAKLEYEINPNFANPSFNHCILHVPSEDYWLECTSKNDPPNFIGYNNANRNVMLVTPEGGKLVKTPTYDHRTNLSENRSTVTLAADGSAIIEATANYKGAFTQEVFRNQKTYYSQTEIEEWFMEHSSIPSFTIRSFEISPEDLEPETKVDYHLDVRRYCSKAGKRFFVPLNVINPLGSVPEKMEKRHFPIVLNHGYTEQDTYTFKIPEGYEIENTPQSAAEVKSDFASYSVKIEKQADGSLTYHRTFQIRPTRMPAEDYDKFREFFLEVSKLDNMKMVLVEKRT